MGVPHLEEFNYNLAVSALSMEIQQIKGCSVRLNVRRQYSSIMNDGIAYLWFYESNDLSPYDSNSSVSLSDSRRLSGNLPMNRLQRHPRRKHSFKLVHFLLFTTSTAVLSSVGNALATPAELDPADDTPLLAQAYPTPRGHSGSYPAPGNSPSYPQGPAGYPGSYGHSGAYPGSYPPSYPAPSSSRGYYSAAPGMSGSSVASVQQRLAELGYYTGPISGSFDATTQQAVIQFQRDNGLVPDGIVGVRTEGALYGSGAAPTAMSPGFVDPYAYPSTASAPPYLQLNQSGTEVSELQQQLAALGYYTGPISGMFDEATQAAVVGFQQAYGLRPDGIVGNATGTALRQAVESSAGSAVDSAAPSSDGLLRLGDTGTGVSDLQTRLRDLGYYHGPINGSFGEQTEAALIAFQQAQGLATDGIAGPQVASALQAAVQPTTPSAAPSADSSPATPVQPVSPAANSTPVVPGEAPTPGPTPGQTPGQTSGQVSVPDLQSIPQGSQPAQPSGQPAIPQPTVPPPLAQPSLPQSSSGPAQSAAYQPRQQGRFSVAELQRRLRANGFNPGEINGIYDAATQSAITEAQRAYGLTGSDL
jgi:peptidoglycan hydrolase-like protein with peptidoglycan-binding domain